MPYWVVFLISLWIIAIINLFRPKRLDDINTIQNDQIKQLIYSINVERAKKSKKELAYDSQLSNVGFNRLSKYTDRELMRHKYLGSDLKRFHIGEYYTVITATLTTDDVVESMVEKHPDVLYHKKFKKIGVANNQSEIIVLFSN